MLTWDKFLSLASNWRIKNLLLIERACTGKPRSIDTRLILTPRFYGRFYLSLGKAHTFSLNSTHLIRIPCFCEQRTLVSCWILSGLSKIEPANVDALNDVASLKPPRWGKLTRPSDESPPNIHYNYLGKWQPNRLLTEKRLCWKKALFELDIKTYYNWVIMVNAQD